MNTQQAKQHRSVVKDSLTVARTRRDKGMWRSAQRANKHHKKFLEDSQLSDCMARDHQRVEWVDCAVSVLRLYLVKHRNQRFICEDVVEFAQGRIDSAPDNRAWGWVIRRALRDRLIRGTNQYRKARSSNLSPKRVWVAA